MAPLEQLEQAYLEARLDPAFQAELKDLLANYAGQNVTLAFETGDPPEIALAVTETVWPPV